MPSATRVKEYDYNPTYRIKAQNFASAQEKAKGIDERATRSRATEVAKHGESRLKAVEGRDE